MLAHASSNVRAGIRPAPASYCTQRLCRVIPATRLTIRAQSASSAAGGDEAKAEAQAWINAWRTKQGLPPLTKAAAPAPAPAAEPVKAAAPAAPAAPAAAEPAQDDFGKYLQLWAGMGVLFGVDQVLKKAVLSAGIKFPSSLVGMFLVVTVLLGVGEKNAAALQAFFGPCLSWIAKWLPLFYVASLVTLPQSLAGIAGDQLVKILIILGAGMVGTLLFTGNTAVVIRALVKTEAKEVPKAKRASPFLPSHYIAWGAIAAASLAATLLIPAKFGAKAALPFNVAMTVMGYLLGNAMPKSLQAIAHPVVVTAVVANASAALHGQIMGLSYYDAQKVYYSKSMASMGAGDFLMNLLGMVIISMGFSIYQQRGTMRRHAPEILGATFLSSLFSFFSTAFVARALGMQHDLARAMLPRSVTVALALPIATQLEAPAAITAAAVLLQGMLGANFGPTLLTLAGVHNTIARGLAAAATAGGLGTASLTAKEPEALPFCALSYSMVGIISTVLASIPAFRTALISIVG